MTHPDPVGQKIREAFSATPQERANAALAVWQWQRSAGIAPEDRIFERDLAIIRQCMERK